MDNADLHHPTWVPPHCPSPKCSFHDPLQPGWPWKHFGVYHRKTYPNRIRRLQCLHCNVTFSSQTFSVTYRANKLLEINLLGLLIRHCEAEHERETIAYVKRRNSAAYKLAIFLVQRNYVKTKRVRRSEQTPAQLVGLCRRRWTFAEVMVRRLFVAQVGLEGRWRQYYCQEVVTRALPVNRRHRLKYAI
jgi:hypothetical protein